MEKFIESIQGSIDIAHCYNRTAQHKAAVAALATKEEVEAYDHTAGYPEKLDFTV